jgi:hypothetical protein
MVAPMRSQNFRRAVVALVTLGLIGEISDPKTAPTGWIGIAGRAAVRTPRR